MFGMVKNETYFGSDLLLLGRLLGGLRLAGLLGALLLDRLAALGSLLLAGLLRRHGCEME